MSKKLLIVDDEIELTQALKTYFEFKGFTVFVAPTAEEALSLIKEQSPDIVTLDILLKGKKDGIDVLREAKNINPSLKIIMITGSDSLEKEKEAKDIGVDRYLKKPLVITELYKIVSQMLEEKE